MKARSVFFSVLTYTNNILFSKLTGFLRDVIIGKYFGIGMISDCFYASFRIPNSFRRLLAEGALSSAFIPIFIESFYKDKQKTIKFASRMMFLLLLIVVGLSIIFEIFMKPITHIITPGFLRTRDAIELLINLSRILFPFIIPICLSGLMGAMLTAMKNFFFVSSGQIILNLGMIIILKILINKNVLPINGVYILSYGIVFLGFIQLAYMFYGCAINNIKPTFMKIKLTTEVKECLKNIVPSFLGFGVYQLNILIDTIIASFFIGGISYLYYTDRVFQLPLTLIGSAISTILLPVLSHGIKDNVNVSKILDKTITTSLFFTIPCAIILLNHSQKIITLLFQGGRFNSTDSYIVSKMLKIIAISLIPMIISKIFTTYLFAKKDTKTPMFSSLIGLIVNFLIAINMIKRKGIYCLAFGMLFSSIVCFFYLYYKILKIEKYNIIKKSYIKIIIPGLIMQMSLMYFLKQHFIVNILLSGIAYLISSFVLNKKEIKEMITSIVTR